ncbi:hypothetical protein NXX78_24415 [Bacteroides fragilis]|nr:hypothetical protein [Bacteroides fragilis]
MEAGSTSGAGVYQYAGSSEYKNVVLFCSCQLYLDGSALPEVNMRADASSRFHKDHRWGIFHFILGGWRHRVKKAS